MRYRPANPAIGSAGTNSVTLCAPSPMSFAIRGLVFAAAGNQSVPAARCLTTAGGSVKQNFDPLPNVDSTQIRPP